MNPKKLEKVFEAFVNHDQETAARYFREYFVENAREINKQLQSQLNEDFGGDQDEDFEDDISVDDETQDDSVNEFSSDDESQDEGSFVSGDEWAEIQSKVDELEALFKELGGDAVVDGDDVDLDLNDEEDDDLDTIEFGDESEDDDEFKVNESISLKPVKDPNMKKETNVDNVKSPVAGNAKSPTGVKASDGWTADGNVTGSNTSLTADGVPSPKVEDKNNVHNSGKEIYKPASVKPKTKEDSVNSKSIVGKK